jgi:hypothetical protein
MMTKLAVSSAETKSKNVTLLDWQARFSTKKHSGFRRLRTLFVTVCATCNNAQSSSLQRWKEIERVEGRGGGDMYKTRDFHSATARHKVLHRERTSFTRFLVNITGTMKTSARLLRTV